MILDGHQEQAINEKIKEYNYFKISNKIKVFLKCI